MHSEEEKIYSAIFVAATVLAIILGFFIIALLRQRKKNTQQYRDKINIEIETLENERKRIARDLHDDIAMLLSLAKVELSAIELPPSDNLELLERGCNRIDTSISKIREIMADLLPTALTRKGLLIALKEFFERINETQKIVIEYSFESKESIPDKIGVHLFRIMQEIVHNAIKHSKASTFTCVFSTSKDELHINTHDDGAGFDEQRVTKESSGLGLYNIISRVELLRGTIYLDTAPQKGVTYTIHIPLSVKI